jgi:hypothetical protein
MDSMLACPGEPNVLRRVIDMEEGSRRVRKGNIGRSWGLEQCDIKKT